MSSKTFPVILIAFGVGFLLYNLGVITFTPWQILWPALLIGFGLNQIHKIIKKGKASSDAAEIVLWLVLITVGVHSGLQLFGITIPTVPRQVFWPVILILIGVIALFPSRRGSVKFEFNGQKLNDEVKSSLIGEVNRGPNWVLDDLQLHHGVGSVNLDLTQAIIPDREVTLEIVGFVGDARIYLPPGLAFKAECSLGVGSLTILEQEDSGLQRYLNMESANYETATQKVNIKVQWKIGEVVIHQIR